PVPTVQLSTHWKGRPRLRTASAWSALRGSARNVLAQHHRADLGAVDVPLVVHGHSLCRARARVVLVGLWVRDERFHETRLEVHDPDPPLESRVPAEVRLGVGDVQLPVVDGDPARPPEIVEISDERSVLLEHLDASVAPVADV